MTNPNQETLDTYNRIVCSSVFRTDGQDIDLCEALINFCTAIEVENNPNWFTLGDDYPAPDLLVAAYWALSDYHGGQYSPEYATLCAVSQLYHPSPIADGPEPDSVESGIYDLFSAYFEAQG